MRRPFLACVRTGARAAAALLLLAPAAAAQQTFEPLPFKPWDSTWRPGIDTTLNCGLIPDYGRPDPYDLGLSTALAAAEQRALTLGRLGLALNWAEREGDRDHIPALKRLVEEYRCDYGNVAVALLAIESAGEPIAYFLDLAADWQRDDRLAASAMNALTVRGDSSAYGPLRAIALEVPARGKFGADVTAAFNSYITGMKEWELFEHYSIREQIDFGARSSLDATRGPVIRSVARGDSVSLMENYNGSRLSAIPRRALRRLARAYPSAINAALVAYADTAKARLLARGQTPADVLLYLPLVVRQGQETAFPSTAPPLPPVVASAALTPAVCVEVPPGRPGDPTAVFSYTSAEPSAVRIAYGPGNAFSDAPGNVSPEVFFPDTQPSAPGRTFRVALSPGATASWTLLGQTVVAGPATRRCGSASG